RAALAVPRGPQRGHQRRPCRAAADAPRNRRRRTAAGVVCAQRILAAGRRPGDAGAGAFAGRAARSDCRAPLGRLDLQAGRRAGGLFDQHRPPLVRRRPVGITRKVGRAMSEPLLTRDLQDLENALKQLAPAGGLERDQLMYRAGRASAPRHGWLWPAAAAGMTAVAIALGGLLMLRPSPAPSEKIVYVTVREQPPPP